MDGLTRDGTAEPVSRGDLILIGNGSTVIPVDVQCCAKRDGHR